MMEIDVLKYGIHRHPLDLKIKTLNLEPYLLFILA